MPSYIGIRTKGYDHISRIVESEARKLVEKFPDQYELVEPVKIMVDPPKAEPEKKKDVVAKPQ